MTWQEVNDMKPGTRVLVVKGRHSYEAGTILERIDASWGWKFVQVNKDTGKGWSCDSGMGNSFKSVPQGWARNEFVYRVMCPEGRNKL